MAQRAAGKTKRREAAAGAGIGRKAAGGRDAAAANIDPRDRIRALEAELAKVRAELSAVRARNKVLEDNQTQVRNRIDWVIDSLHNLMEK